MINKKVAKNVTIVILSNVIKLIVSLLTIFILPKLFTQQDYGYYKLFLLYTTYVGVLNFGFIDGVYLHYGGKNYDDLPKNIFRAFSKFLFLFQTVVFIILFCSAFFFDGERQLVLFLVSGSMLATNLTGLYQFISQITERFKELSIINTVTALLNIVIVLFFYFLKIESYLLFLIFTVILNFIILAWYIVIYRDIVFGKNIHVRSVLPEIMKMFKLGFPLMISYFVATLMTTISRQFVEIVYPIETYPDIFSNFAFAFTLMGFANVFVTAIGLVIYPTLKKTGRDQLYKHYKNLNSMILILLFIAFIAYFPVKYVVNNFMSEYNDSLIIFYILIPTIAITATITIVKHNYYKTLDMNKEFLIIGIISCLLTVIIITIAFYLINQSVVTIAIASLISIFIWDIAIETYLAKKIKVYQVKNFLFLIVSSTVFYLMNFISKWWIAGIIYGIIVLIVSIVFYFKNVIDGVKWLKNKQIKNL